MAMVAILGLAVYGYDGNPFSSFETFMAYDNMFNKICS